MAHTQRTLNQNPPLGLFRGGIALTRSKKQPGHCGGGRVVSLWLNNPNHGGLNHD
jgi:hypothetical protein